MQNGLWPTLTFAIEVKDQFLNDGKICDEFAENASIVGHRREHRAPLFCVGRDVYARVLVVYPAVKDH